MSFEKLFGLNGKRAVVTGGSRGLGRAMTMALAEAGADIAITGRPQDRLDKTAGEIGAFGRKVWTFKADMAVPAECETTLERIVREIGAPDILINNLGNREVNVSIEAESLGTCQRMIDLNLPPGRGHREPGLVGAALATGTLDVGLVADGFHVDAAAKGLPLAPSKGRARFSW
ncbi:NAD dependent epimerase/dehydratase family protein [Neorhizobium galegae bv. orientalis]|nr:NAD dependent epimerase/dehydratase family protein [Neorhizobium galegae bv. orientalis]